MHAISTESDGVWSQIAPILDESLEELSEKDRVAILLRFFEGKVFAEVGVALGTSEDAARMRVDRALEKLRGLLVKRGVGITSAALAALISQEAVQGAPAGLVARVKVRLAAGAGTASLPALTFLQSLRLFPAPGATLAFAAVVGSLTFLSVGLAHFQPEVIQPVKPTVASEARVATGHSQAARTVPMPVKGEDNIELEKEVAMLRAVLTEPGEGPYQHIISGDSANRVALVAARAFWSAHQRVRLEVLKEALGNSEQLIRLRAIHAMMYAAGPSEVRTEAIRVLIEAVGQESSTQQQEVLWVLNSLPLHGSELTELIPLLENPSTSSWAADYAEEIVANYPREAGPYHAALEALLWSENPCAQFAAASGLARYKAHEDPRILEILREFYAAKNVKKEVRDAFATVLPQTEEAFPELYAEVRRLHDRWKEQAVAPGNSPAE